MRIAMCSIRVLSSHLGQVEKGGFERSARQVFYLTIHQKATHIFGDRRDCRVSTHGEYHLLSDETPTPFAMRNQQGESG